MTTIPYTVSIKPLTNLSQNIQISLGAAADPERAVVMCRYETASQTIFSNSLIISVLQ